MGTGKTLVRENPPRFVAIGVRGFGCCCPRDMQGCSGASADKELLFLESEKSKDASKLLNRKHSSKVATARYNLEGIQKVLTRGFA